MPTDEILKEQYTEDLNSKIFYKISFSIKANKGYDELDLLWEVVLHMFASILPPFLAIV